MATIGNFVIGITVYSNYHLLDKLLENIKWATLYPREITIVDNSQGRGYLLDSKRWPFPVKLIRNSYNIGCPASWNLLGRLYSNENLFLIEANTYLPPDSLEYMSTLGKDIVLGLGYNCFYITPKVWELVGPFDEGLWPAGYEDLDYKIRLASFINSGELTYEEILTLSTTPLDRLSQMKLEYNWDARNKAYMIDKWGFDDIENLETVHFDTPWDGNIPETLDWELGYRQRTKSDINEHLKLLNELACKCKHITEFGTRHAISTIALLAARPEKLFAYDLHHRLDSDILYHLRGNTEVRKIIEDTSKAVIEPTDLLFIDSRHAYDHVKKELLNGNKVNRFIVFHDTVTFGERGDDKLTPGINQAIREFMQDNPCWKMTVEYKNQHGLTVLTRD